MKLPQNVHRLGCQRDKMSRAHFHPLGRDIPLCPIQIDFRPFRGPQFTGANEDQRSKAKRRFGSQMSLVAINGA
jgi:hypothetical protein